MRLQLALNVRDLDAANRIRPAGLQYSIENDTTCCHARQNKVWAQEPEGLRWEGYRVIEDVKLESLRSSVQSASVG